MTREESYRRVQRRDSMICAAVCCAVLLAVLVALPLVAQGESAHQPSVAESFVCVQAGDTLWDISSRHRTASQSVSECLQWIVERNGLTSSLIVPGQIIEVPRA